MNLYLALGISFTMMALLSYKWEYTAMTRAKLRQRRNRQWLLVVALLFCGVSSLTAGIIRLL